MVNFSRITHLTVLALMFTSETKEISHDNLDIAISPLSHGTQFET